MSETTENIHITSSSPTGEKELNSLPTEKVPTSTDDNKNRKVVIQLDNVKREFVVGEETVYALRGVSFKIYEGEFVTIMGKSGSGKSTLLNQLGCLDTPSSGEFYLDGTSVRTMSKSQRAVLRNRKIGFIFQNYNLLPKTTSVENVELPLMYNNDVNAKERFERAVEALKAVGLGERLYHKSNQMSGGQMQRVAIARALVNNPAVILADEATGNLDTRTSFEILVLFQKLHAEGRTIIFVTHNPDLANYSSRNIELRDGKVISDKYNDNILSAAEALAALPKNNDD
ncbi:ABC transporter ATP-binding protein [Prevotella melaninogenica]